MKITQLTDNCFRISIVLRKGEGVDILVDPFDILPSSKTKADIWVLTQAKPGLKEKDVFLIDGPGEYEIKEIFVEGFGIPRGNAQGGLEKNQIQGGTTIYSIKAEDMKVCYLGNYGYKELTSEQLERLNSIDVLILPVGMPLFPKEMQAIVSQIEPMVLVITQQRGEKLKTKLKEFLKEMGIKQFEEQEQASLKKKEFKEEELEIVVLKP